MTPLAELILGIHAARCERYSDEEILGYLCVRNANGLQPYLLELRRAGYGATAILQYLEMSMVLGPMVADALALRNQPPETVSQSSKWIN